MAFMSRDMPITRIDPDPDQPRKHFDPQAVRELAASIEAAGLASPIMVRPVGDRYTIVHGERRYRAVQSLGWDTIPAIVREVDADEAHWLALIENVQRQDLTPMEEAEAYQARLAADMTQEELGRRIGKSQSAIAQKLRLLTLPEPIAIYVRRGALSEGHARQLLRVRGWLHGLTTEFDGVTAESSVTMREELGLTAFVLTTTIALRPEDNPIAGLVPEDAAQATVMADACEALWAYIEAQSPQVPLWACHAFWWASFTVRFGMSVANLQTGLDHWHERFLSTIMWGLSHERTPEPTGEGRWRELERIAWWGYRSDLRHSRIAPHIDARTLPRALADEVLEYFEHANTFVLPSVMQPWGTRAREGAELHALEDGATEEEVIAMRGGVA
jgi:ParB/RepB/Spo0J family partition protein